MEQFIKDELHYCDNDKKYDCVNCCDLEECYSTACDIYNHTYAALNDYSGFDSEEEFWSNLLD